MFDARDAPARSPDKTTKKKEEEEDIVNGSSRIFRCHVMLHLSVEPQEIYSEPRDTTVSRDEIPRISYAVSRSFGVQC